MSVPAEVSPSAYSKDRPFPAKLSENRLLCRPGSAKETRHFVVDLRGSGMHYKAGDSLGVFPSNRPSEVDDILKLLGVSGEERVSPAGLRLTEPIALRAALTDRLALSKPTRKMVEALGGTITIDSWAGSGTCVVVTLPIAMQPTPERAASRRVDW